MGSRIGAKSSSKTQVSTVVKRFDTKLNTGPKMFFSTHSNTFWNNPR